MERICYRGARECAEALGVTRDTLVKIVKNDPTFPVIKTGPRNSLCLYPVDQIKEWMAMRTGGRLVIDPALDRLDEQEKVDA